MRRHYIFIPTYLRQYALQAGATDSDWAKSLFDDITENGSKLTVAPLGANERGERIALYGDKFYCQAGVDLNREDCLFVFRIERADDRLPTSIPTRYDGEYRVLTASRTGIVQLDPVATLLGITEKPAPLPPPPAISARTTLTAQANELIGRAPDSLRLRWRPGHEVTRTNQVDEFLAQIRRPWIRFRLDQYSRPTPRQDALLKDLMHPQQLLQKDRDGLLGLFSLDLINSIVRQNSKADGMFYSMLEELSHLDLPAYVQGSIWGAMLAGLDSLSTRRELYSVADALESIHPQQEISPDWENPVLRAIRASASRNSDDTLIELADRAESEGRALAVISAWSKRLQFQEALPKEEEQELIPPELLIFPEHSNRDVKPSRPALAETTQSASVPRGFHKPLDRWVLRMGMPDVERIESLTVEMENAFLELAVVATEAKTIHGMIGLLDQLASIQTKLAAWINELPSDEQLKKDYAAAEAVYESANLTLPGTLEPLLENARISPLDLAQIITLLGQRELLAALPQWIIEADEENVERLQGIEGLDPWALRLLNPLLRQRISVVLDMYAQFGNGDITRLSLLPPIGGVSDIEQLGQHVRDIFKGIGQLVSSLTPETNALWKSVAFGGPTDFYSLQRFLELLKYFTDHTSPDTSRQIIQYMAGLSEDRREQEANIYADAVQFFEAQFGSARDVTFPLYQAWASNRAKEMTRHEGAEYRESEISIEHNWTDLSARRVPLTFSSYSNPDRPYGFVSVPLLLETKHAKACSLSFEITVRSEQRKAWPSDWDDPTPTELTIPAFNWRKHPDKNTYIHTFKLAIPMRNPITDSKRNDKFEVGVRCLDVNSGTPLSQLKLLKWDSFQGPTPHLTIDWPEVIDPNYVISHPIGPQQELEKIKNRISGGGSFAVIAPRRFGKTTLVEYLRQLEADLAFVIPPPIVCTDRDHFDGTSIDYNSIWDRISMNLQAILGSSLTKSWQQDGIPDATAFDHVRRSAKSGGKKGILLLFDEAQLLFPKRGGHIIGDQIKDRLERAWGRTDNPELIPVLIGFIGLPSIKERAGANLMGLLRPIVKTQIDEDQLNSLILSVTRKNLSTTREARQYIAKAAGNLFILRTLLENLISLLNQERRIWANYDDAVAVQAMLKASLREGQELNVHSYIRDALNDGETINDWNPGPSFPVAVALAIARSRSLGWRTEELLNSVAQILAEWCSQGNNADPITRPVYERHRIDEHITTLRERNVLTEDLEFVSELLEAWLLGLGKTGMPRDAEFQQALFQGAVVRIRIPEGLEPVGEGSQAEVFRYTEKNVTYALRRIKLRGEEDRGRFLETNRALEIVKSRIQVREQGSEYIFNLQRMGIAENDEECAIQIYHWIAGTDLGKRLGQLPSYFAADIGVKLTSALRFLHRNNILHRDIRPQNIILTEEDFKPVLLDFGFARMMDAKMSSNIDNKYSAPEVRQNAPLWSKAADVFSLASTLDDLLDPTDKYLVLVQKALASCKGAPESRPTAEEMYDRMTALHHELNVNRRRDDAWNAVTQISAEDQGKPWFWKVLTKFRPYVEASSLGVHPEQFDRCREVANFLNQVLEAFPTGTAERLTLGKLKSEAEFGRDSELLDGISFLHALRTYASHGNTRDKQRLLKGFSSPTAEDMKVLTRAATNNIATTTQIACLRKLVEFLLTGEFDGRSRAVPA